MQNNLREVSKIIYRLKRQFGLRLDYYIPTGDDHDVETGEINRSYTVHSIKRAILLPSRIDRSFVYDLTFIAANNNFVGGGFFDIKNRVILIDGKDIKFEPTLNDHVEFEDDRYEIKEINQLAGKHAYLLRVQAIDSGEAVNYES
ncbi:hypothetical protein OAF54_02860 [bacterium]|nr:hypothetical protein [bacterium]